MSWEQFGLKENPYDMHPLLEGGDLPIVEAFVGRKKERKYLNDLFLSDNRVCLTICGNVGVGKTSITNFQKFTWKYLEKEKPLFSFRREIEAHESNLNKKSFILEIIASVLREIELVDPELLTNSDFLMKLNQMINITRTLGLSGSVSAGAFGLSFQSDVTEKQNIQPFYLSMASLEQQFNDLLQFILTHKIAGIQYQGLIVHTNNFEIAMNANKKKVLQFFAEIRDFLQTSHVYFIFLGPNNFFKEIIAKELRVRSIFEQTPIILPPLSKDELIQALNKRLELLQSPTAQTIVKPVEDAVIAELYDMFSGDIRMIMSSLKDVVTYLSDKLTNTLTVNEAMFFLGKERLSHIEETLTEEQMKVLAYIVSQEKPITQKQIAENLKKDQRNVAHYYFKPLIEHDVIEVKNETGKQKYWGLTKKYLPLKTVLQFQKKIQEEITSLSKQLASFN